MSQLLLVLVAFGLKIKKISYQGLTEQLLIIKVSMETIGDQRNAKGSIAYNSLYWMRIFLLATLLSYQIL